MISKFSFISGLIMLTGAFFHIACLIAGPIYLEFAGAPIWAIESSIEGSWPVIVVTILIAALLLVWAVYSFSAAGIVGKLTMLKLVLSLIAAVLILRGVLFLPLLPYWNWTDPLYLFHGSLSFLILAMGIGYTFVAWRA